MNGTAAWRASVLLGVLLLGGCGPHGHLDTGTSGDTGANEYPANYKSDILSAMHAYLNDPTGIRDAAISEPALKPSGNATRYAVCVKFNPKKNAKEYAGVKEMQHAMKNRCEDDSGGDDDNETGKDCVGPGKDFAGCRLQFAHRAQIG